LFFRPVPDPELFHHLANHCADAARVVFQECDGQGCAEFEAFKENNGLRSGDEGAWRIESGLGPNRMATEWKFIYMEMNDTE
jgi:hypothetical protein